MLYRVEILKREPKRVIYARYKSGASMEEVQEFAACEQERHAGDGVCIRDLHTGDISRTWKRT